MKYQISRHGVKVQSDYWVTEHVKRMGGALASVAFTRGSRKNILVSPMTSYFRRKEGGNYVYYEEAGYSRPEMSVTAKGENVVVETGGQYANKEGKTIPARYRRIYEYRPYGLIKVRLEMECRKPIDAVMEVGASSCRVDSRLNTVAYRAAPEMSHDPTFFTRCAWHEFSGTGSSYRDNQLTCGRYMPLYLGVMERGVEGLEWILGDNYRAFGSVLTGEGGQSFCGVIPDPGKNAFWIKIEPYGNWAVPIELKPGIYVFEYYLGLPFSKGRNVVPRQWHHMGISNDWPNEKTLDHYASCGVRLLRLHNDYREDGNFWHDGCYPPYDPENMKRMDWVIEQAHERGMKIVPYFSLKELHPDCPEYGRHVEEWKRVIDREQNVMHNYYGSGEFGVQMCLKSGWLDYRKKSIDLVLARHQFDGIYYDWVLGLYCLHPGHMNGKPHTDAEELLDLLQWTRRRVGVSGMVFIHLSGLPMMTVENLTDLVITHEEMTDISPIPGGFCPEADYAGIVGHVICGAGGKKFILSCFVEGLFSYHDDAALEEMKKLSAYPLEEYKFEKGSRAAVATNGPEIVASLYWRRDRALIYAVNLGSQRRAADLKVDLMKRGWPAQRRVICRASSANRQVTVKSLLTRGISVSLPALESRLIEIG